jgi:hypothetical protein
MLGFCVPVPSLSGRSASLRVLPERAAGRFLKHLIWRILLVIRRPVCGVESIFLPGLREGRSKPAGLVDEVAQRLAGEETAAVVEDDLAAPVAERTAIAGRARTLNCDPQINPRQFCRCRWISIDDLGRFTPLFLRAAVIGANRTNRVVGESRGPPARVVPVAKQLSSELHR